MFIEEVAPKIFDYMIGLENLVLEKFICYLRPLSHFKDFLRWSELDSDKILPSIGWNKRNYHAYCCPIFDILFNIILIDCKYNNTSFGPIFIYFLFFLLQKTMLDIF